jgi:hypothetical protein
MKECELDTDLWWFASLGFVSVDQIDNFESVL